MSRITSAPPASVAAPPTLPSASPRPAPRPPPPPVVATIPASELPLGTTKLTRAPASAGTLAAPAAAAQPGGGAGTLQDLDTWTVGPQDSWESIARAHGISAAALMQANPGVQLALGTKIAIPPLGGGGTAAGSRSTETAATGAAWPHGLRGLLPQLLPCLLGVHVGCGVSRGREGARRTGPLFPHDGQANT